MLRSQVWRNHARNRILARLARLLAGNDRAELAAAFPAVAAIADLPMPAAVLVVAGNLEHARALARRLKGWEIVGPAVSTTGVAFGNDRPKGQIVSVAGLRDVSLLDVDVVVRADAGTGALPLPPWALAVSSAGPVRPLVMIDTDDRHHPELRRRSRDRRAAYAEQGWLHVGQDHVDLALHFVLGQQEG